LGQVGSSVKPYKRGYSGGGIRGERGKILEEALVLSREDLIKALGPLRSLKG